MNVAEAEAQEWKRRQKSWFPVILITLALFLLVCVLFGGNCSGPPGNLLRVKAKNDVTVLTGAIKAYYREYNRMPTGTNPEIIRSLSGDNPKKIVFFETNRRQTSGIGEFLDPWRQPYQIDTSTPDSPWIYSFGPNRRDDDGAQGFDDVVNWR